MKHSGRKITKIVSMLLVFIMIFGYSVLVSAGIPQDDSDAVISQKETDQDAAFDLTSLGLENLIQSDTIGKEETVYVIAAADGSVEKIIVSELIKNTLAEEKLYDETGLADIVNVKNDASYTMSETGYIWDAQGEDIYYQGTTKEHLPVTLRISFRLDGKDVSVDEIAGASGKAEITFQYFNTQKETVSINGEEEDIYVPFLMLSGMVLENDKFSHVAVSSGKVIDDGDKTVVVGYAVSGLQQNLKLDTLEDIFPSSFTITADVKDFALETTLTLATNSIFNAVDFSNVEKADIEDIVEELTDGIGRLSEGADALYDGMEKMLGSTGDLIDGIKTLTNYAEQLSEGASTLYNGLNQAYTDGVEPLNTGLSALSGKSAELNGGAKTIFETLLTTVQKQLSDAGLDALGIKVPDLTIENYDEQLEKLIAALSEEQVTAIASDAASQKVNAAIEAETGTITAMVTAAVKEQVTAQVTGTVEASVREQVTAGVREQVLAAVLNTAGVTEESYHSSAAVKTQIDVAVDMQMGSDSVKSQIDFMTEAQMKTTDVQDMIDTYTAATMKSDEIQETIASHIAEQKQKAYEENMAGAEVKAAITSAVASAREGAAAVSSAKASLDAYKTFYEGVLTYTAGVDTAAAGMKEFEATYKNMILPGSREIKAGMEDYAAGINELNDRMPELSDGVKQLEEGAYQLKDGVNELNKKVKDVLEHVADLDIFFARLEATFDVSRDYQSFGGIPEDMKGTTKFIYRTDSIQ